MVLLRRGLKFLIRLPFLACSLVHKRDAHDDSRSLGSRLCLCPSSALALLLSRRLLWPCYLCEYKASLAWTLLWRTGSAMDFAFDVKEANAQALAYVRKESLDIFNRIHSVQEDVGFVGRVHEAYLELPILRMFSLIMYSG